MLARLSIRAKITSVIAFLLMIMLVSGMLAVSSMRSINSSAAEIENVWLPKVRTLGELRVGIGIYRNMIREHMLNEAAGEKDRMAGMMAERDQLNVKTRDKYESIINTPEERALFNDWKRQWDVYKKGTEEVIALSRASAGKVAAEAQTLHSKTVNPISQKAEELLVAAVNLNNKGAAEAGKYAAGTFDFAFMAQAIALTIAAVLGIGIGIYLVRDVSSGIASIVTPMQALGNGDLSAVVPHRGETTEIGSMADALQVFKQALIDKKAADDAAMVDAEEKIRRGERVNTITRDFEAMIGQIVETVSHASTELEASAGTLTATAERSQQLTTMVAAASEEASTNVQSVASATEEMASSVNEISRQVQDSARIAGEAVAQAEKTNDRVGELAKAAARIGDVVELINTIAGQTNLLALNATIEAARAGDAGRGFAVVASEVKALAEQTAKATGEISAQINGIQAATQESVNAIQEIGTTIGRMSEIASTIASAVEEQGAATQEISRNVQQAAQGTQQVSANITDVQHGASETGSASSQVLSAAQSLSTESSRLKLEVGRFLSSVRAA
ncbi:methyl-accepting chemotaxis protein [Rhodopseudomonas sp. RCAM05734]|uniref:methyl-accepting chemotaxis protein n=1 Tax=Rhodopseudomonas sp. RCAM05734 TaxID=3457549 RepID=UPI0040443155